jgi:pimeloyl-ACP methyl ester carboxylesterase
MTQTRNRRSLIKAGLLSAGGLSMPGARAVGLEPGHSAASAPLNFVLVHGAWHGGWCWGKVADILRQKGHRTFAPSLTGLGDRAHLFGISPEIHLSTHISDIVALVESWDLSDIVLCGHSYGGMVITGVAERIPQRIGSIVYVDALMPQNGQSAVDIVGPPPVALRGKHPTVPNAAAFVTDPKDQRWVQGKLTPLPPAVATDKLVVTGAYQRIARKTAVRATGADGTQLGREPGASYFAALAKTGDWSLHDIASEHDIMIDKPAELAAIFLRSAPPAATSALS